MKLNTEQTLAASHYEGPCLVTSCPGSGKTAVITSRVVSLVKKHKIEPRNILCLTFTNKAANEMKERITADLGEIAGKIWISTFHRLCLAVLRKHGSLIGLSSNFSIYSSKEQDELMTKLARMHEYESTSRSAIQRLTKAINDFREDIVDFEQHLQELNHLEVAIVKDYQKTLDQLNAVDFSGMLYKAWTIIKNNPAVGESMSKRFQHVLVDEFQDTNHVQYDIIRRIALHQNLFVVADPQQSIYGFRGAKPENLKRFVEECKNTRQITLPRNYRSTASILQAAQNLIRNNDDAQNVELHADRGEGSSIRVESFFNPEQEATKLAQSIQMMKNSFGYDWKDFAILYRANSLSRSPEMALRSRGIPYRILGGFSFFDRTEIKTTLSYLSFLANPHDSINFARAITNPKRGIGNDTIGKLEKICEQTKDTISVALRSAKIPKISAKATANLGQFMTMMDKYKKMEGEVSLSELTERLMKESGYYDQVKAMDQNEESHKSRLENLDEFIASIAEFESCRSNPSIADYLQSIQLLTNNDKEDVNSEDSVKLLTMHSSKGLEWPCVYIIGVERGYIPHAKSQGKKSIEEERRLLYVAITRSMSHLFVSYCDNRRGRRTGPSFFLNEMGSTTQGH